MIKLKFGRKAKQENPKTALSTEYAQWMWDSGSC